MSVIIWKNELDESRKTGRLNNENELYFADGEVEITITSYVGDYYIYLTIGDLETLLDAAKETKKAGEG